MLYVFRGDDKILAEFVLPAQHDVRVRVQCIDMVGGYPVELCPEVLLHPVHEAPDQGLQILILVAVLCRDDEPELMAVVA
jgi:hypothetical protein